MQIKEKTGIDSQERSILVFPATHPAGREFIEAARERGENVISASSVLDVESEEELGQLVRLPHVYDADFQAQFLALVRKHHVASVYAPVAAVYAWLEQFIRNSGFPIRLIGTSPIKREMGRFNRLMDKTARYENFIEACADGHHALSRLEIASVFKAANNIYGESNDQKIAAMMAIFSSAVKGDVIEIGSLAGKSAVVLALMARRYAIGNVLAIDPWLQETATQRDSPDTISGDLMSEWNYETLPQNFTISLLPAGLGIMNYLRAESAQGFDTYRNCLEVTSPIFGRVGYEGRISVIHIDGNHDYAQVRQDCDLWLPLMAPGGWLILDDYLWAHGDGPYRVGNTLLAEHADEIERSFVCGKALFVMFSQTPGQGRRPQ